MTIGEQRKDREGTMATYSEVMGEINAFLKDINKLQPLQDTLFRGVFVKRLSNSNLVPGKKYKFLETGTKTNQTHLDLTGQDTLKFFFGNNNDAENEYTQIMIDIPVDHLKFLECIDIQSEHIEKKGREKADAVVLKRDISEGYDFDHGSDLYYYAYAYKKQEGHVGEQSQINRLHNRDKYFDLCACAYEGDFMVFLQHTLNHYVCLLIPSEFADGLTGVLGTGSNFPFVNSAFNEEQSREDFCVVIKENVKQEFSEIDEAVIDEPLEKKGYDKEQITKVRVGQGAFRRLLIEQRGCTCQLCNINVPEVLRASHIKSWKESSAEEKLDTQNGLLLCANHDALFDRNMITIDIETDQLLISTLVPKDQYSELKLDDAKQIRMGERMKAYMREHNKSFEK